MCRTDFCGSGFLLNEGAMRSKVLRRQLLRLVTTFAWPLLALLVRFDNEPFAPDLLLSESLCLSLSVAKNVFDGKKIFVSRWTSCYR